MKVVSGQYEGGGLCSVAEAIVGRVSHREDAEGKGSGQEVPAGTQCALLGRDGEPGWSPRPTQHWFCRPTSYMCTHTRAHTRNRYVPAHTHSPASTSHVVPSDGILEKAKL